ncbi:MAG: HAD family hydrolase [Candidatus Bathyarchaeia archaeon]
MRFKVILFDLGGTLITRDMEDKDVDEVALRSLLWRLHSLGYVISERTLIDQYWSHYETLNALREKFMVEVPMRFWLGGLIAELFGRVDGGLLDLFEAAITDARVGSAAAYPDTLPALEELSCEYRLGAVTNTSSDEITRRILKQLRLNRFFECVVTSAELGIRKPYPGIFLYALREMRVKTEDTLFIGDSPKHDVAGSRQVGIKSCLMNRGEVEYRVLEPKPDLLLSDLNELLKIL